MAAIARATRSVVTTLSHSPAPLAMLRKYSSTPPSNHSRQLTDKLGRGYVKQDFISDTVHFTNQNDNIHLAGTFTQPTWGVSHTTAVLVHPAGPLSRVGCVHYQPFFTSLKQYLLSRGICILTFDKRGVGRSEGNFRNSTIDEFADDVVSAVDYLNHDQRRVGLIGLGEGGITASLAAAKEKSNVAFLVTMSTPATNGEVLINERLGRYLQLSEIPEAEYLEVQETVEKVLRQLKEGHKRHEVMCRLQSMLSRVMDKLNAQQQKQFIDCHMLITHLTGAISTESFIQGLSLEPTEIWKKVKTPILAMHGDQDEEVPLYHVDVMEDALIASDHPRFTIVRKKEYNHIFQRCTSGSGMPSEYIKNPPGMGPEIADQIMDWFIALGAERK